MPLDQLPTLKRIFINTLPESISYMFCIWILSDIKNYLGIYFGRDPELMKRE
jgi:hypothetical protein